MLWRVRSLTDIERPGCKGAWEHGTGGVGGGVVVGGEGCVYSGRRGHAGRRRRGRSSHRLVLVSRLLGRRLGMVKSLGHLGHCLLLEHLKVLWVATSSEGGGGGRGGVGHEEARGASAPCGRGFGVGGGCVWAGGWARCKGGRASIKRASTGHHVGGAGTDVLGARGDRGGGLRWGGGQVSARAPPTAASPSPAPLPRRAQRTHAHTLLLKSRT